MTTYVTINFVLWYCLPLVVMIAVYTRISCQLWRSTNYGEHGGGGGGVSDNAENASSSSASTVAESKMASLRAYRGFSGRGSNSERFKQHKPVLGKSKSAFATANKASERSTALNAAAAAAAATTYKHIDMNSDGEANLDLLPISLSRQHNKNASYVCHQKHHHRHVISKPKSLFGRVQQFSLNTGRQRKMRASSSDCASGNEGDPYHSRVKAPRRYSPSPSASTASSKMTRTASMPVTRHDYISFSASIHDGKHNGTHHIAINVDVDHATTSPSNSTQFSTLSSSLKRRIRRHSMSRGSLLQNAWRVNQKRRKRHGSVARVCDVDGNSCRQVSEELSSLTSYEYEHDGLGTIATSTSGSIQSKVTLKGRKRLHFRPKSLKLDRQYSSGSRLLGTPQSAATSPLSKLDVTHSRRRAIKLLIAIIASFALCSMPYQVCGSTMAYGFSTVPA